MRLTFASYNIHKAIGSDRRRDPRRTLDVIDELAADVVALQEVDRRLGRRLAVLDRAELEARGWQLASQPLTEASLGWHGNLLLVRQGIAIRSLEPVELPRLEQRGALRAVLELGGRQLCVASMHLDLSGIRRRQQLRAMCHAGRATNLPAVMLGDLNEWSLARGGLKGLADEWQVITPGRTFPARRPLLSLDRVIHSPHWRCEGARVHASHLARAASDHLPILAELALTA